MKTTTATRYGAIFFQSIVISFNHFAYFTQFVSNAQQDLQRRLPFIGAFAVLLELFADRLNARYLEVIADVFDALDEFLVFARVIAVAMPVLARR